MNKDINKKFWNSGQLKNKADCVNLKEREKSLATVYVRVKGGLPTFDQDNKVFEQDKLNFLDSQKSWKKQS